MQCSILMGMNHPISFWSNSEKDGNKIAVHVRYELRGMPSFHLIPLILKSHWLDPRLRMRFATRHSRTLPILPLVNLGCIFIFFNNQAHSTLVLIRKLAHKLNESYSCLETMSNFRRGTWSAIFGPLPTWFLGLDLCEREREMSKVDVVWTWTRGCMGAQMVRLSYASSSSSSYQLQLYIMILKSNVYVK